MPGENILQTLQKVATVLHRLDVQSEEIRELRATVVAGFDKLGARVSKIEDQMSDLRERLARLEASRDADRAQMQADLARFKAEVERAELRLTRRLPQSERPAALPEERTEET
jgi:predicted nuclease with TOPRIM domain